MTAADNPSPARRPGRQARSQRRPAPRATQGPGVPGIRGNPDGEGYLLDVLILAGAVPADGVEWLLVTELDGKPGAGFQVQLVPGDAEHAQGRDG
jgi:hypothetical protein